MRTLHGAKQSVDTAGRQVIATRWLGEDATFAKRPWEPSPNYTGGLKPGDPFYTSETFPIVWRLTKWKELFFLFQDCDKQLFFFKTVINSGITVTDPRPVPQPLRRKSLVQSAKYVLCYYVYLFPMPFKGYVWIWTQTFTDWWLRSLLWLKKS